MDITSYILGRNAGSSGANVKYVVVEELPTTGEEGIIYLVPKSTSKTNNIYDEYMYISNNWELIGDTEADLSNYLAKNNTTAFTPSGDYNPSTKKYVDDNLNDKQNTLVSGTNIKTINNTSILGSGNINISENKLSDLPSTSSESPFDFDDASNIGIYYTNLNASEIKFYFKENSTSVSSYRFNRLMIFIMNKTLSDANTSERIGYALCRNSQYSLASVIFAKNSSGNVIASGGDLGKILIEGVNQSFSGVKTFGSLPESSATPTTNSQLTNKKYVDDSISSAITDALTGSY